MTNDPLTHFRPVFPFHTPWKHQKNRFLEIVRGYKTRILTWNGSENLLASNLAKSQQTNACTITIKTLGLATYIWKFVQRQLPHLEINQRYRCILYGYSSKVTIFHTFFLIFWDLSLLHSSLSSINSIWRQQHLCSTSEWLFLWFASCNHVKNRNVLTELEGRKTYFHSFFKK